MHYAALALEKVAGSQESLSEKCAHGGSGENLNQERRMSQPSDGSKPKEGITIFDNFFKNAQVFYT